MSRDRGDVNLLPNDEVEWTVPDLDFPEMNDGSVYFSPVFKQGEELWQLHIGPNGCFWKDTEGYVDVGLQRFSSGPPLLVQFSFALKAAKGQKHSERLETEIFQNSYTHYIHRLLSRTDYERRKSELCVSGCITVVCSLKIFSAELKNVSKEDSQSLLERTLKEKFDIKKELDSYRTDLILTRGKLEGLVDEMELLKKKFEKTQLVLKRTIKEKEDTSKELDSSKANNEILLKEKLSVEADLKVMKENLATATQEKEVLTFEVSNLIKSNDVLTRDKDETAVKYEKVLAESYMKNSQLAEELFAVSQELETEKNERKRLESELSTMEKKICDLQSEAQDNIGISSAVETNENEGTAEIPTAAVSINEADKPKTVDSGDSKHDHDDTKRIETDSSKVYDIVTNINCFLKEKKGVDVTFILETSDGDSEVSAHKLVLAMRSSVFGDEFYSGKRNEEHTTISLKGVDPEAFQKVIRYCYDCEPELKAIEEACALIQLALKFGVTSLVDECGAYLRHTEIEPGNFFMVLHASEQMGDIILTDKCLKMLEEETENIVTSFELRDVTPSIVQSILKLTKLSLHSEYELILWILDWAQLKSGDKDSNCKSTRHYLGNLLEEMNFLSLTGEQFAKICKDHPEFFTANEIASLSLNIMMPGTRELPKWYNKDLKSRVYTGSQK